MGKMTFQCEHKMDRGQGKASKIQNCILYNWCGDILHFCKLSLHNLGTFHFKLVHFHNCIFSSEISCCFMILIPLSTFSYKLSISSHHYTLDQIFLSMDNLFWDIFKYPLDASNKSERVNPSKLLLESCLKLIL